MGRLLCRLGSFEIQAAVTTAVLFLWFVFRPIFDVFYFSFASVYQIPTPPCEETSPQCPDICFLNQGYGHPQSQDEKANKQSIDLPWRDLSYFHFPSSNINQISSGRATLDGSRKKP